MKSIFVIILFAIILISSIRGFQKGFLVTMLTFFRWVACIAGAFFLGSGFANFLKQYTGLGDKVFDYVSENLAPESLLTMDSSSFLYRTVGKFLDIPYIPKYAPKDFYTSEQTTSYFYDAVSTLCLFVIAFFILLTFFYILSIIILRNIKPGSKSVIGILDHLGGLIFGLSRGLLISGAFYIPLKLFEILFQSGG